MSYLNIKWLGHAGFRIAFNDPENADQERVIYIDIWNNNPNMPEDWKDKTLDDADLILVTHGHFDHSADAPSIVKASIKKNVKLISNFELGVYYNKVSKVEQSNLD
jgi:L-ascorbate metabolism protein UlaG (beta-lactamase superfamily)